MKTIPKYKFTMKFLNLLSYVATNDCFHQYVLS